MSVSWDEKLKLYIFQCPHCKEFCAVTKDDVRCTIFRHAVYKKNMRFVNPHASKEECERWLQEDLVFGCTKPFKFDGKTVEICGYI